MVAATAFALVSHWVFGAAEAEAWSPAAGDLALDAAFIAGTGILIWWLVRPVAREVAERRRIEGALRESEELYRGLVETSPDAIALADLEGGIVAVNQRCVELWGTESAEDLVGRNVLEFVLPEDRSAAERNMARVATEGVLRAARYRALRRDGTDWLAQVSASLKRDAEGRPAGFILITRDITEETRRDEALRRSEEAYRTLAEAARDIIFVIDRHDRVVFVNSFAAELLRTTPDTLVGRPRSELFPSEMAERHGLELAKVLQTGEPLYAEGPAAFTEGQVWLGTWLVPLKSTRGDAEAVLGISRDITDRKRAEEALRESEARYRGLVDHSKDAIVLVRLDGSIEYASPALGEMLGYSPEEFVRDPLLPARLVHPESRDTLEHLMRAWVEREELPDGPVDLAWVTQDGATVYTEVVVTPLRGAAGEPSGVQVVARDVTERRRIEELKSEFLAMVSHEMRTPLTSIIGYCALLERAGEATEDELTSTVIERLCGRSEHMLRLVEELLEALQIDSGEFELHLETVDFQALVDECIGQVTHAGRHHVELDVEADLEPVECDPRRLSSAVGNLLTNAVKFSPDGGEIRVSMATRDGEVRVVVTDPGVGIPPEALETIFDRFTQADMSGTRRFGGFGMGLHIVRSIVEAHGGSVGVSSVPGEGSTFTVRMPLRQTPALS